jgi:hypothetical protein
LYKKNRAKKALKKHAAGGSNPDGSEPDEAMNLNPLQWF